MTSFDVYEKLRFLYIEETIVAQILFIGIFTMKHNLHKNNNIIKNFATVTIFICHKNYNPNELYYIMLCLKNKFYFVSYA